MRKGTCMCTRCSQDEAVASMLHMRLFIPISVPMAQSCHCWSLQESTGRIWSRVRIRQNVDAGNNGGRSKKRTHNSKFILLIHTYWEQEFPNSNSCPWQHSLVSFETSVPYILCSTHWLLWQGGVCMWLLELCSASAPQRLHRLPRHLRSHQLMPSVCTIGG